MDAFKTKKVHSAVFFLIADLFFSSDSSYYSYMVQCTYISLLLMLRKTNNFYLFLKCISVFSDQTLVDIADRYNVHVLSIGKHTFFNFLNQTLDTIASSMYINILC